MDKTVSINTTHQYIKTHTPYKVQRQTEYNKSNTLSFTATQKQNHQPEPAR